MTGEVDFSKPTVTVAARAQLLERINAIEIPANVLDVTEAEEDVATLVDVKEYLPDGVILAEENFEGKVNVVARVEAEAERAVRIPVGSIQFTGIPNGYRAVITEPANECSVVLVGLQAALNEITAEDVTAMVDLEAWMEIEDLDELTEGSYWIPVDVMTTNGALRQSGATEVRVHIIEEE